MIEGSTPFLARGHRVVVAVGVASLLFGVIWAITSSDEGFVATNGADGFSRSAIGFKAFGELLERSGIEVVHSRFRSVERERPEDLLVLAAPDVGPETGEMHAEKDELLRGALEKSARLLLILPKWRARKVGDAEESFVRRVEPVDPARVAALVARLAPDGVVVQVAAPSFTLNAFGASPELDGAQLLRDVPITPLLSGDDGVLVGSLRTEGRQRLVLSDPDLVSNGGLARGENAALALALVDALRGEGGRVLFDETLHGFERVPSVWRELGRAPLHFGSAHLLLLALAALLAGSVRFGRPRPLRGGWREGKQALLDNTAELMELVGHSPHAVGRYFDATIERLTEALHAPTALDRRGRAQWLESRLAEAHRRELAELAEAVAPADAAAPASRRSRRAALRELAARIHRFREEVLHGAR